MITFFFKYADKGISVTNRDHAEAEIWRGIEEEDVEIIASHFVDMAKDSRIVATAIRRMSNSYRLLQIGMITTPRFLMTAQFYQMHGGFTMLPMRRNR